AVANTNTILAALGTGASGNALSVSSDLILPSFLTGQLAATSLTGSDPAVMGPPVNITNSALSLFNPYGVTGGNPLLTDMLGDSLRVDTFQLGKVYVFGNTFNANYNMMGTFGSSNTQFFINLLAQNLSSGGGGGEPYEGSPEPGTVLLISTGL